MKAFLHKNLNIFVAFVLACALAMGYTTWSLDTTQAAQQQQGKVIETNLCQTFGALAANKPPAGNPIANPSRAYLQKLHEEFIQLGRDVGCP